MPQKEFIKLIATPDGYQYVSRVIGKRGAVVIIPIFKEEGKEIKLQLILSKRPTFDKPILEFPAGLVDDDEAVEACVLRELKEETGWNGDIYSILEPSPSSAGLSDELLHIAIVYLTTTEEHNHQGDEKITILPLMSSFDFLKFISNNDVLVSSRLACYMIGFGLGKDAGK